MPTATKRPAAPSTAKNGSTQPAAIKEIQSSLEAAEKAINDMRHDLGEGARALLKDVERLVKDARRDLAKLDKAIRADLGDFGSAVRPDGRRPAKARAAAKTKRPIATKR